MQIYLLSSVVHRLALTIPIWWMAEIYRPTQTASNKATKTPDCFWLSSLLSVLWHCSFLFLSASKNKNENSVIVYSPSNISKPVWILSKWWQNFHFWVNYLFKCIFLSAHTHTCTCAKRWLFHINCLGQGQVYLYSALKATSTDQGAAQPKHQKYQPTKIIKTYNI